MAQIESIITDDDQRTPESGYFKPSRKRRIAKGAGVDISEVNRLVKQFEQSKKMKRSGYDGYGGKKKVQTSLLTHR